MKKGKLQHKELKKNRFKIPEGYFDTVEDTVFAKLSAEKLPNKEGFSTPPTYFDNVEDSVFDNLQKEKPTKQTGFSTPVNYLDSVEENVIAKLKENKKQVKVIDFRSIILKRAIPFAAAASLLLFIVINFSNRSTGFDTVATTEIEQWIEDDLITLDTYEIAEVYNDTELESSDIFEEDELLEYLNGTDIESLLIEN